MKLILQQESFIHSFTEQCLTLVSAWLPVVNPLPMVSLSELSYGTAISLFWRPRWYDSTENVNKLKVLCRPSLTSPTHSRFPRHCSGATNIHFVHCPLRPGSTAARSIRHQLPTHHRYPINSLHSSSALAYLVLEGTTSLSLPREAMAFSCRLRVPSLPPASLSSPLLPS